MKYIRTKDGVYYVPSLRYQNPEKCECEHGLIIEQADTIEELCDYIVYNEYAENGNGKLMFKKISLDFVKEQLKLVMLDGAGNVKLAILTDKGLIYVAKMNEKGELELL